MVLGTELKIITIQNKKYIISISEELDNDQQSLITEVKGPWIDKALMKQ